MNLKLDKLFEVTYPSFYSQQKKDELKQKISNLKIDNMLNISKKKREKFFVVVTETQQEIDFRISPHFELIDPVKMVSNTEEYDFMVINEGLSNNDYENFSTNININLIDLHCNNAFTRLSIKKMLQEFNYPEEITNTLEEETNMLNALYENDSNADTLSVEVITDEEIELEVDDFLEDSTLEENNQEPTDDEEQNNQESNVRKVHISRMSYLCGFDFHITKDDNDVIVTDILEKGIADKKLFNGDKILKIDNIDVNNTSYTELIKYVCSKLEITLTVLNDNIPKKKNESSISNFYRIMGNKYLKLSFFKKNYDYKTKKYNFDNISYITTIVLSNDFSYPKLLNFDNTTLSQDNIDLFFNLEYFENFYGNYHEMSMLYEYLNEGEYDNILNQEFYEIITKIRSGYYFNINSIIWNIYLSVLLCSFVDEDSVNNLAYTNFEKKNTRQLYFPNYKKKTASCFEVAFVKSINIVCDICKQVVSDNLSKQYYSNNRFGDICEKCYEEKKNMFKKRINYLKRLILLEGKKVIFLKELERTKQFLENYEIKKINETKKVDLIKKANNSLLVKETNKICKICFEVMDEDLCASVNCGHCFHYSCIQNMGSFNCPACRVNTKYVKLYF